MVNFVIWRTGIDPWGGSHKVNEITPGYESSPTDYDIDKWLVSKGFNFSIEDVVMSSPMIEWALTELSADFTNFNDTIYFKTKEDKVKFILRWVE